ncbi:hypothetical protein [Alteromonas lipotrueiana]|uniref:hypothetical protein n=1 Tax=Alteromonas lipotrueiana TaxID=2803815 RepID=UPI001C4870AF|nr:hypothetical protein [Alteromonas lipotrueiana]
MMVTDEEYAKYLEYYNRKSLFESALIFAIFSVTALLVLVVDSEFYQLAFYVSLVLLIAYMSVEEKPEYLITSNDEKNVESRHLQKAFAIMTFFLWSSALESMMFGVNSSKLIGVYSLLTGVSFMSVMAQLPFFLYFRTNSVKVYYTAIWLFRLGGLTLTVFGIYVLVNGAWNVNISLPF